MIKILGIAALAIVVTAPAFAQIAPTPYWGWGPFATPRQSGPVASGTATVPGPRYPNRAQKSLDSASH
jgi:hypothetical protein